MRKTASGLPDISPPIVAKALPLDTTRMGQLRVRAWDVGSRRYVPLYYSLGYPDHSFVYGNFHAGTGSGGWSPAHWVDPGRYIIEFEKFPCGNSEWRFRSPASGHGSCAHRRNAWCDHQNGPEQGRSCRNVRDH